MFEQASRLKIRYATDRGNITTEDLWDIPLTSKNGLSLDNIAKGLYRELREADEVSFVDSNKTNYLIQLKFDIVKHIIDVNIAENVKAKDALMNKEKKDKLAYIIQQKENEDLK